MSPPEPAAPTPLDEARLRELLRDELRGWTVELTPAREGTPGRTELFRAHRFPSFQAAIDFMARMAPTCDAQDHHPRWENTWRTLKIWLCTHEGGLNGVTERDLQLARAMEKEIREKEGREEGPRTP